MTHEAAWSIFTDTGDPFAYLLYCCGAEAAPGDDTPDE